MNNFALLGAAGYIAPRHMGAIRDTNNNLLAALDPNDSVGIIDSYFPDAHFFTEFERFDRHIDKLKRSPAGQQIHYMSICSPNYLHDSHMRFALRSGSDAICEKPLVLNPWNIDALHEIEKDTGKSINTILQLRLHKSIVELREKVQSTPDTKKFDVNLTYITSRGRWYYQSWKGDEKKAGGIATNIGVHFFDMLQYIFGPLQTSTLHASDDKKAAGFLEYKRARVRWYLSIDVNDVPDSIRAIGQRTFRSIAVNNEEIEFSSGFTELHTRSYEQILAGNGYGLEENRAAIETVANIRNAELAPLTGDFHPFLQH